MIPGVVAATASTVVIANFSVSDTDGPSPASDYPIDADEIDLTWIATPANMGTVTKLSIPVTATTAGHHFKGVIYLGSTRALVATSAEITTTGSEDALEFVFDQELDPSTEYGFGVHSQSTGVSFEGSFQAGLIADFRFSFAAQTYASGPIDPMPAVGAGATGDQGGFVLTVTYTPV